VLYLTARKGTPFVLGCAVRIKDRPPGRPGGLLLGFLCPCPGGPRLGHRASIPTHPHAYSLPPSRQNPPGRFCWPLWWASTPGFVASGRPWLSPCGRDTPPWQGPRAPRLPLPGSASPPGELPHVGKPPIEALIDWSFHAPNLPTPPGTPSPFGDLHPRVSGAGDPPPSGTKAPAPSRRR